MIIRRVEPSEKQLINEIVKIHLDTFVGFFLTSLGKGFLNQMYRSYSEEKESNLLAAIVQGKVIGFLAYSGNMSGLYKYMIKKRLPLFAWYGLGAFFQKPAIFMRLCRAFLKPGESQRSEKYVELASIGVTPDMESKGVGTELINELKELVDFNKYAYITLETDAADNKKANEFYKKNGFCLERVYLTHEGRKMNEYRFKP